MKRIIITAAGILLSIGLFSQSYTTVGYNISLPMGPSADYTPDVSFRGASIDFSRILGKNFAVGFHISMSTFTDQVEDGKIELINGIITGKQYKYLNTIPIYISTRYMGHKGNVVPYGGLGIGTLVSERRTDMGLYSISDKAWHFALSPEAGIMIIMPAYDMGINLGVRYNYGFEKSDMAAAQYLSFVIGISIVGD